jgi:hypothetical protein
VQTKNQSRMWYDTVSPTWKTNRPAFPAASEAAQASLRSAASASQLVTGSEHRVPMQR